VPVAATALALCLLPLVASQPADAAFPGSNGLIAFHSDRDVGAGEIYTINPAVTGDTPERITFTNGSKDPAWSPDGSKIAFVSHRPGDTNRNVYVMNSNGSGTAANLTENDDDPVYQGHDDGPSWSPDGSRIVYSNGTSDSECTR
jgi:Tol biopolymer transport system component